MDNLIKITGHLTVKTQNSQYQFPELITVKDGSYSFIDEAEDYWRIFNYISDTATIDSVAQPLHAFEASKAFGHFICQLSDLDVYEIKETIDHFHDYPDRIKKFKNSLQVNFSGRAKTCGDEIDYAENHFDLIESFTALHLPVRIIHSDAKIDNILFDRLLEKAISVIDLDIAMPASPLYDFGDMVRSYTNTTREDDPELEKLDIKIDIFSALADGFLLETSEILTDNEKNNLLLGAKLVIFIQGVRNLTDYLNGDIYYKINYPEHNLHRAQNQFSLLRKIEQNEDTLQDILSKTIESYM